MMNRREFLKATLLASSAPFWARLNAFAEDAGPVPIPNHLLLVIFLAGGNDGLNTVVPYLDPTYKRLRPTVALAKSEVFPLGQGLGLHRSMPTVNKLWRAGQVAVVQNVGYADPNFSHFESTEIWETGSPDRRFYAGWLGRYLDATDAPAKGPVRAVAIGTPSVPRTITGASGTGVTLNSLSEFDFADRGYAAEDVGLRRSAFDGFRAGVAADGSMRSKVVGAQSRMVGAVRTVSGAAGRFTIENPTPSQIVAQMFDVGVGTEIGFIGLGAFDTHVGQREAQAASLQQADEAIGAFFDAAKALGLADRATVLTFSDFGRRVGENAGSGTDHGSSMPMFVIGQRVQGGFVGNRPDLDRLSVDGNIVPAIPMQAVYATILERGFRVPSSAILGGAYPLLPIYR
jgi:uncharacterized protein (DUF1501 family)